MSDSRHGRPAFSPPGVAMKGFAACSAGLTQSRSPASTPPEDPLTGPGRAKPGEENYQMPWFRKKSAEVIRKGVGNDTVVEERTTRMVAGELVEVRRVRDPRSSDPGARAEAERTAPNLP